MRFRAFDEGVRSRRLFNYSIGGGFILREGQTGDSRPLKPVPYPFSSADELLHIGHEHARTIWQIALENEKAWRSEEEIRAYVRSIMQHSVQRGLRTEGFCQAGSMSAGVRRVLLRSLRMEAAPIHLLLWIGSTSLRWL
jgi:L-serine dehydratase